MSCEPRPPSIENPFALAAAGDRATAIARENALRQFFADGLARLAAEGADGAAALEELEDCARIRIGRYNEDHNLTPVAGAPNTEVNRPNTERTDPKTAKPPRCKREGSGKS